MRYGAIDIGSNAVRLMVKEIRVDGEGLRSDKVSYTRVPIRLGEDVFEFGRIRSEKQQALTHAIEAFGLLMQSMGVVNFRACATSAMREAENGKEVVAHIENTTGVAIEIIGGREEADLIFSNFSLATLEQNQDYLYVDVGGGSTELTLIRGGARVEAKSFRIGSVRLLKDKVSPQVREDMRQWCMDLQEKHAVSSPVFIGSGGNINRLYKLAGGVGKAPILKEDLKAACARLKGATYREKLDRFGLKPDRADVIVPACQIYLEAMELFDSRSIVVPKVGLGDGMILQLHKAQRQG